MGVGGGAQPSRNSGPVSDREFALSWCQRQSENSVQRSHVEQVEKWNRVVEDSGDCQEPRSQNL